MREILPDWCQPGRNVVCLGTFERWETMLVRQGLLWPRLRGVYTIRGVVHNPGGTVGLTLDEVRNPPMLWRDGYSEIRFSHRFFRPLPRLGVADFACVSEPTREMETA